MALIGRIYAPDVAILPIGDHFTMGPREAAVAAELDRCPTVVPSHYGTFPLLTGTPDALRESAAAGHRAARAGAGRDGRAVTPRERWFGATGRKVPEVALAGTIDLAGRSCSTTIERRRGAPAAHADGIPVVVRADTAEEVAAALARPEVSCVLVEDDRPARRSISPTSPMASGRLVTADSVRAGDLDRGLR